MWAAPCRELKAKRGLRFAVDLESPPATFAPREFEFVILDSPALAREPDLTRDRPVWLSTAGGGVSWLHVRLDDWPKYYAFEP